MKRISLLPPSLLRSCSDGLIGCLFTVLGRWCTAFSGAVAFMEAGSIFWQPEVRVLLLGSVFGTRVPFLFGLGTSQGPRCSAWLPPLSPD